MRRIDLHYASGWDFLDDYKMLLGAVVIALEQASEGDTLLFCCRFGGNPHTYRWPAHIKKAGLHKAGRDNGVLVVFAPELREEIERTAWAHAQGDAKRRENRLEPPLSLEAICERQGQADGQRVVAVDLSLGGCKLRSDERAYQQDDEIVLTWARAQTVGRVRWVDGGVFGVAFHTPLPSMQALLSPDIS